MLERLFESVGSLGGPWAYAAVAILAAGESSIGVGLVVPGETAMIVGGFIVSQGNADFGVMLVVAFAGAVVGDTIGYEIGRHFGPRIRATRLGQRIGEERWTQSQEYLTRRGGRAIFFARFVAVVRSLIPAVAGISRMPYRRFLAFNALGGAVWATIYVSIGYFAGRSYERVAGAAEGAGYVVLALVVLVVVVVAGAKWAAAHPERVQAVNQRLHRLGLGRPVRFVQRRFSIDDAFGLSLTAGLGVLFLAGWGFSVVLFDVLNERDLVRVDRPLARYLADHRVDWLTDTMRWVTDAGSVVWLGPLLLLTGLLWVGRTRRWGVLLFFAVAIGGGVFLTNVLKEVADRPRPPEVWQVEDVAGRSFPSGHTTHAAIAYGALAYVHGAAVRRWPARVAIWAAAVTVVLLVAFSRLYLGVHWLTDVLGGAALGAGWLAVVVTAFGAGSRLWRQQMLRTAP